MYKPKFGWAIREKKTREITEKWFNEVYKDFENHVYYSSDGIQLELPFEYFGRN